MKKILNCFFALISALSVTHTSQANIVDVCGTDTIILQAGNYQYGTIQWQESYDLNTWKNIPNAQETTYKFFPTETKYYRAVVKYSDCPPEYSDTSLVQLPPLADAGADRVAPGNTVSLTANSVTAALGTWSILSGTNGSFSNTNDPKAVFQGNDTLYVLVYSLSNACGTDKDTIEVRFKINQYIDQIVVVDTTDLLLSDSAQIAQGEYKIYFSSPIPAITDSTILVGIINNGFLRKVNSFTVLADTFTMQTSQATLEDIIIDGAVNVAQIFAVDTTTGKKPYDPQRLDRIPTRLELNTDPKFQTGDVFYYFPGEKVEYIHHGITLNQKMTGAGNYLIDVNFNSALFNIGGASLVLNGYYKFEPNIIADLDYKWLKLKTARIGMYNGIIERNYQLSLSAATSLSLLDHPFTLLSISKPIIMVIGTVPVYIVARLELNGKISANISASMNFVHDYTKTSTHNANIEYLNQQWSFNYNETSQMVTGNSFSITGNLTQSFEIGPELSFKIYGIMGPYVEARLTEDIDLCSDVSSNWSGNINIGGHLSVGAKAEVQNKIISWTIFDIYKTWAQDFYSIQVPYNIAIESGNNQNYTAGNALPNEVQVHVTASSGFSVPGATVHFNPQDGGSVANSTVTTNNNGIAATIWTPGGATQSQLETTILDCYGNHLSNSPVLFNAYETMQSANCTTSSLSVSIVKNGNTISPLAHNGVSPYTYSTDGVNFSTVVPQITTLAGQAYTFTVKDANGCTASEGYLEPANACVNSNLSLNVQVSGSSVTVTAQGGAMPYLYALDDTNNFSSGNVFNNVPVGLHDVFVKDADACIASTGISVTDTTQPTPNTAPNPPANPIPADGAVSQSITTTLSWTCNDPDGDALIYDIYFDTLSNPSLVQSNISNTAYNPGTLDSNTTYYWKVVANDNNGGITTGNIWSFTTASGGGSSTMTDSRDGQVYNIVKIGNQWWMAENLNFGAYVAVTTGGQDPANTQKYCQNLSGVNDPTCPMGGLYEWAEMMDGITVNNTNAVSDGGNPGTTQGVCPVGWHIPTDLEWCTMENAVEVNTDASCNLTGWRGTNTGSRMKDNVNWNGTNSSGFAALPGGYSWSGSFYRAGTSGYWWSSTEISGAFAWRRYLHSPEARSYRINHSKLFGISVRCVQD